MSWDQIAADPSFQELPEEHRARIQENYFQDRIAPNVPAEKMDDVRASFLGTSKKKEAASPAVPSACDQYVKAAGQLIAHATIAARDAAARPVEGILEQSGKEASKVTEKLGLPNVDSPAIVERLTKAAHESAIQLGIKPTEEEKVENPTIAALGITRPLRAYQTLIDRALPEVAALKPWFDQKEKPLTDRIDWAINRLQEKARLEESEIAPVETTTKEIPKFNLFRRAVTETGGQVLFGGMKTAEAMLNPVNLVEAELTGRAVGAVARGGAELVARSAPEAALRAQLSPVSKIGEDSLARLNKPAEAWTPMDHVHEHVQGTTNAILEGVQERTGASPAVMRAAAEEIDQAGYENVYRHMNGLKPRPRVPSQSLRGLVAKPVDLPTPPAGLLTAGAEAASEAPSRPIPTAPKDVAVEVAAAGSLSPEAAAVAKDYPSLYSVATGAKIPQAAEAEMQGVMVDLARSGIKPAPIIDMLKEGIATGKASFVRLAKLNDALYQATLAEQGAHPQTIRRHMADAYTASQRPAETVVLHHMEAEANQKAVAARALATQDVWDEAHRVIQEEEAKARVVVGPDSDAMPTHGGEGWENDRGAIPGEIFAWKGGTGPGDAPLAIIENAPVGSGPRTYSAFANDTPVLNPNAEKHGIKDDRFLTAAEASRAAELAANGNFPLPGRAEALAHAESAGVPIEEAAEIHRQEALKEMQAGTLDPGIAQEYADAGDTDFDPANLEIYGSGDFDQSTPPGSMTWEEFSAEYPGVEKATHDAMVEQMRVEVLEYQEREARNDLEAAGITAQPVMDALRNNPIEERYAKANGISGDLLAALKRRGIVVSKKLGEAGQIDSAVTRAKESGALGPDADINDLIDALEAEERKGTRAEAEATLVKEGKPPAYGEPPKRPGPASTQGNAGLAPIPREILLSEGPFRRAYPYTTSIEGKSFVVKTAADDLSLHEAFKHGGDPASNEFRQARSMVYHDEAHGHLADFWNAKKAGKNPATPEALLKDDLYKHLLLKHGDAPVESTPEWVIAAQKNPGRPAFEKMTSAIRLPSGEIRTGVDHKAIVASISDAKEQAAARHADNEETKDSGFIDVDGKFITRDESQAKYGFRHSEELTERVSKDSQVSEGSHRDLIVQHNVTAENILHVEKIGGMAAPSLAITKSAHPLEGFGEITLLGHPDILSGAKVYGADIYSPRYPDVQYKVTDKAWDALRSKLSPALEAIGARLDSDELERKGPDYLQNDPAVMWTFLKESGVTPKVVYEEGVSAKEVKSLREFGFEEYFGKTDFQELMRDSGFQKKAFDKFSSDMKKAGAEDLIEAPFDELDAEKRVNIARQLAYKMKQVGANAEVRMGATRDAMRDQIKGRLDAKFEEFADNLFSSLNAEERIFKGFTNSGRKSYMAHTLENVIRELKKNLRAGEGFHYGVGSLRAELTPQFRGIERIRAEKGRLIPKEDFQKIKDQVDSEFFKLSDELAPYYNYEVRTFQFSDTVMAVLADGAKKGFPYSFKEYGFDNVPEDVQRRLADYLDKLRGLPTEYFEAKLPRAVGLREFSSAVVPEGTSQKAIDALERSGVKVSFYKKGDIADRKRAIREAASGGGLLFDRHEPKPGLSETGAYAMEDAGSGGPARRSPTGSKSKPSSPDRQDKSSSSDKSVAPATTAVNRLSQEEQQLAFDLGGKTLEQYVKKVADDIREVRKAFPNFKAMAKAIEDLENTGKVDYRGKEVAGPLDAAELFASSPLRRPDIEHFQIMLVKNGKVIEHPTITSGVVDLSMITMDFNNDVKALIVATGADGYYMLHNHPSGNPAPSEDDRTATRMMVSQIGPGFKGHVVVDDTQFSLIDETGRHTTHDFTTPKTNYRPDRWEIEYDKDTIAVVSRELSNKEHAGLLLLDARHRLLGFEYVPAGEDIVARSISSLKYFRASKMILGVNAETYTKLKSASFPKQLLDAVVFDGEKPMSLRAAHGYVHLRGRTSAWSIDHVTRVAEDAPRYMAKHGMDMDDFRKAIAEAKIAPGSKVTASERLRDLKKGTPGKVVSIGQKNPTLLVQFEGEILPRSVRPESLVETNRVPAARAAVEAAQAAREIAGKPIIPIKKIVKEQQAGTAAETPIQIDELKLLAEKFKNQAKGARMGAREGARAMRAKMEQRIDEFHDKLAQMKEQVRFGKAEAKANADWLEAEQRAIRQGIVDYLNDALPLEARGKFLATVKNADTVSKLLFARQALDDAAAQIYKKGLLGDIRKMVDRVLESPGVDVKAKAEVRAYLSDVEIHGRSAATYARLRKTLDFITRQEATGQKVDMPKAVWEELDILGRRPLKEMNETELEGIHQRLQMLEDIGRTTVKVREGLYLLERERINAEILADLKPIEARALRQPQGFKPLPRATQIQNAIKRKLNAAYDKYMAITPPDVVWDMLSKVTQYSGAMVRHFAHGIGADYARHIDLYDAPIQTARAIIDKHNLSEEQIARVTAHAYLRQNGGAEYLKNEARLSEADIKSVEKITPDENELYDAWRSALDSVYPQLADTLRFNDNMAVGRQTNYFPVRFDPTRAVEADDDLAKMVRGLHQGFQKNVRMANIQKRTGSDRVVALDGQRTFENYMRLAAYKIAMSRRVRMLGEIVNTPEFQQGAGEFGGRYARQFITMLARRGAPRANQLIPWMDSARRNGSVFAIVGRLPTAAVHMTLLTNAAAISGPGPIFGAFRDVMAADMRRDSSLEEFWRKNDPLYRQSHGSDPVFQDAADVAHWNSRTWWKAVTTPTSLRYIVRKATLAALEGNYRAALARRGFPREGPVHPEALDEARLITRRAIPSPELPHMFLAYNSGDVLTGNLSMNRAATQFKNFTIDRWSAYAHDFPEMLQKGNYADTANFVFWQTMSDFVEVGIRHGYKVALAAALGAGAADEMDEDHRKFWGELLMKILEKPPFVPDILNMALYGRVPTTAASLVFDGVRSAGAAYRAHELAQTRKFYQKITEALVDLASLAVPIPFGGTIEQVMRMTLADGGVRFPYADERTRLNNLHKDARALPEELERRVVLNHAYARFEKLNANYKRAMQDGRKEDAADILEAMKTVAHEAKPK